MSNANAIQKFDLKALEQVVSECQLTQLENQGQFERAFTLARGIRQLREMITADVMKDIQSLQGTALGFRTDRDQPKWDDRAGRYVDQEPYGLAVVKDCLIEAVLRGAFPVGNEFNIISSRAYLTKEFFLRAVGSAPGVTDVRAQPGVPVMRDGGAIVPFTISWRKNGVPDKIERSIPVRINKQMGADAIIGKATRKAYAAAYQQITGSQLTIPDGDIDDVVGDPIIVQPTQAGKVNPMTEKAREAKEKANGTATAPAAPSAPAGKAESDGNNTAAPAADPADSITPEEEAEQLRREMGERIDQGPDAGKQEDTPKSDARTFRNDKFYDELWNLAKGMGSTMADHTSAIRNTLVNLKILNAKEKIEKDHWQKLTQEQMNVIWTCVKDARGYWAYLQK